METNNIICQTRSNIHYTEYSIRSQCINLIQKLVPNTPYKTLPQKM